MRPSFALLLALVVGLGAPNGRSANGGYHAIVDDRLVANADGSCQGSLSVTSAESVSPGDRVLILVTIDRCVVVAASVAVHSPTPKSPILDGGDPCERTGCPDPPSKPGSGFSSGEAQWQTDFCDPHGGCWAHGTLTVDVYQSYHQANDDNLQGDAVGVSCAAGGAYQQQACDKFVGPQYGSKISAEARGAGTFPRPYGSYDLEGHAVLDSYMDGSHRTTCTFAGSAAPQTAQVACS